MLSEAKVLCVDLDGTLLRSDTLYELLARMLRRNPLYIFLLPFWILRGRAFLKRKLTSLFGEYIDTLPYSDVVVSYINEAKSSGRKLYLATACDEILARKIADKFGIFDDVFGSNSGLNLKSSEKAKFLVSKFGSGNFDYMGDSNSDFPVWDVCKCAIGVNLSQRLAKNFKKKYSNSKILYSSNQKSWLNGIFSFLREMRIHQWAKNILVFVPLVLSHNYLQINGILNSIAAFFAFSFCASATYIFNDILDIESDRRHRQKKNRPIASGEVSIPSAISLCIILAMATLGICACLPIDFSFVLFSYVLATLSYSFYFKRKLLADVMLLAILYTVRIYAGACATGIEISFWLFAFSVFIFLSLAFLKRFVEVKDMSESEPVEGRAYIGSDAFILGAMGVSSGFVSALTYMVYVDFAAGVFYGAPQVLLFCVVPIALFICRIWIRAGRGQVHSDPIFSALKDSYNYALALIVLLIFILAQPK